MEGMNTPASQTLILGLHYVGRSTHSHHRSKAVATLVSKIPGARKCAGERLVSDFDYPMASFRLVFTIFKPNNVSA
jgi:hypothetical protein